MLAGASAVAVGAYNFVNPAAVGEIAVGIDQYCIEQHITNVSDLVGMLEE